MTWKRGLLLTAGIVLLVVALALVLWLRVDYPRAPATMYFGGALESMTTGAAWQIHMEDHLGSITPGKYADLVILDSNPLETPMSRFRDIQVLKTIVNGNEIALD